MNITRKKYLYVILVVIITVYLFYFSSPHVDNISEIEDNFKYSLQAKKYISTDNLKKKMVDFDNIANEVITVTKLKLEGDFQSIKLNKLKKIAEMLHNQSNILQVDELIINLLESNDISRQEKIKDMWELVNIFEISSAQGMYLLDYLSILQPIELTDELISSYHSESDNDFKIKIMDILVSSLDIANPESQTESQLAFISVKSESIQTFLYDVLLSTNENTIFSKSLDLYSNVASTDKTQEFIQSMMEGGFVKFSYDKNQTTTILTEVALSTDSSQKSLLPSIINSLQNDHLNQEASAAFNQVIIDAITSTQHGNIISKENTEVLTHYLKDQEPALSIDEDTSIEILDNYYSWALAVNNLTTTNQAEKNYQLVETTINQTNPLKISAIILYSDESIIDAIKLDQRYQSVIDKLTISLTNPKITKESKVVLEDAMDLILK